MRWPHWPDDEERGPMTDGGMEEVCGFHVRMDVAYDPESHMWVQSAPGGRVRIGLEPLEVEASGTVAAVTVEGRGTRLARGEQVGSLEAEKFVGPLRCPLSGVVAAVNEVVVEHPSKVDSDPYGSWLVELEPTNLDEETEHLVSGRAAIREWFSAQVSEYRLKGVLAE
jgi:glycine cleavage system H protein